jgi:hypothetical protein
MTFRSSRTLPGQGYARSASAASGDSERPRCSTSAPQDHLRQDVDVVAALAGQGGDGEDVQPVVQVAAERPRPHLHVERLVRRRDHPNVDRPRHAAAQPHDLLLLQHAEERRLRG